MGRVLGIVDNPVYDIDLDDVVWTPSYVVPFSVVKPTKISTQFHFDAYSIAGKEWVRYAHILIPFEMLHFENYHSGGCLSSVGHHNDLFTIQYFSPSLSFSLTRSKRWFPHNLTDVDTRWVSLKLESYRSHELEISDAHHVPQPIVIPHKNDLDRLDSPVDVVFYELGREGNFERFTANKRKILYPERELCFFSLAYNPYINIHDSKTATMLYLPRGVYVDLAEMQLMYDAGKLPLFVSYTDFVDTDASYEEAKPQVIVFIAESTIYPLYVACTSLDCSPPTLTVNFSIPIHFRSTRQNETVQVSIPPPAFFAQSPVRDSLIVRAERGNEA